MATEVSESEIWQCLLKSIEESIPTNFDERKIVFGKNASIYSQVNRRL